MRWASKRAMIAAMGGIVLSVGVASLAAAEPRDPFMFGARATDAATGRGQLNGILWDAAKPLAIIDGEPRDIGAVVDGWTVVSIAPDQVVIERAGRRETLVIGAAIPSQ